jgi:hypothetical protein
MDACLSIKVYHEVSSVPQQQKHLQSFAGVFVVVFWIFE